MTAYREFEAHHRQALWESAHVLQIIVGPSRAKDPRLSFFYEERRRRRSWSSPQWKVVLRIVLEILVGGQCDLDILLDPFFLHFPGRFETSWWYPGFGRRQNNIPKLASALHLADSADPWRSQYRAAIADHPGSSIDRLRTKFVAQ
uniref:Uncharacterized protein n=1 Tax=Peronospora matthiolae TaxID=2874970 RepID=A0AAV1UFL6_9STRA